MTQLTFLSEEPHANRSASQDCGRDWMIRVATSCSPSLQLLHDIGPDGWFGRTSPASCHLTEGGILEPSSRRWGKSGMGSPTEFWTLNTSEWPSDAAVCSLSDVLEIGDVPQRFFLSAKACQGILRRAERRGKKLPELLDRSLRECIKGQEEQKPCLHLLPLRSTLHSALSLALRIST